MYKKEIGKILCPVTYGPPCTIISLKSLSQSFSMSITKKVHVAIIVKSKHFISCLYRNSSTREIEQDKDSFFKKQFDS